MDYTIAKKMVYETKKLPTTWINTQKCYQIRVDINGHLFIQQLTHHNLNGAHFYRDGSDPLNKEKHVILHIMGLLW